MITSTRLQGIAVVLVLLVVAPVAFGHTGRPPPRPDPEPIDEPTDATPNLPPLHMPPPLQPKQPHATPTPVVTTPTVTPTRRVGATTPSVDYEAWDYWWAFRRGAYDDVKRLEDRVSTGRSVFDLGAGNNDAGQARAVRRAIETKVVPVLMLTARGGGTQPKPLTAAALIALGKVASKPAHVELILRALDAETGLRRDVRAGAALACGTLRRDVADDQLPNADLDRVRRVLLERIADEQEVPEVRGASALAIGLLGDQPGVSSPAVTLTRLFNVLRRTEKRPNLAVALMTATSMFPEDALAEWQRAVLRKVVREQRLFDRKVRARELAAAAHALGRIGAAADVGTLKDLYADRRIDDADVKRSTVLGLAALAARLQPVQRVRIAALLLEIAENAKATSVRNASTMALAELIAADIEAGRQATLLQTGAADVLTARAKDGRSPERTFGGLAVGVIARAIPRETEVRALGAWRAGALTLLREQLARERLDPMSRAAYATALGLAGDVRSHDALVALLSSPRVNDRLRSYAAEALGRLGRSSRPALTALRKALVERRSDSLQERAAMGLGLLGDRTATPLLLAELERASNQYVRAQAVNALARIGDDRAVVALIELTRSATAQASVRTAAARGLGLIGNLERVPHRARFERFVDYLSPIPVTNLALASL